MRNSVIVLLSLRVNRSTLLLCLRAITRENEAIKAFLAFCARVFANPPPNSIIIEVLKSNADVCGV